jgi:hypothetical protein
MTRARTILTKKQRTSEESRAEDTSAAVTSIETERLGRRLAEMVAALTESDSDAALDAVRAILATDSTVDPLEVVAMAVIAIEARERGQLRVPGYLRADDPQRTVSARRALRRARPSPVARPRARAEAPAGDGGVILDLRAEHARVHLDLTGHEPR